MRHRVLTIALCIAAAACSSAPRPKGLNRADVDVRLTNTLFFSSSGTAAANFEIDVTNTAEMPITVHAVRLSSPGMVEYALRPVERLMNETIDPGESTTITMAAMFVGPAGTRESTEPLGIRVFLDFEADGKRHHDYFNILNVSQ
jgi:hypothetical protein